MNVKDPSRIAGIPASNPVPIAEKTGGKNVAKNNVSDAVRRQAVSSASIPSQISATLNPNLPNTQVAVNPRHQQKTPITSAIPASKPPRYCVRETAFESTPRIRRDR